MGLGGAPYGHYPVPGQVYVCGHYNNVPQGEAKRTVIKNIRTNKKVKKVRRAGLPVLPVLPFFKNNKAHKKRLPPVLPYGKRWREFC